MIYVIKLRYPQTDNIYWYGYKNLADAKKAARSEAKSGCNVTVIKCDNPYDTITGGREFDTRIIIGKSTTNGKMRWKLDNYEYDTWHYDSVPVSLLDNIK